MIKNNANILNCCYFYLLTFFLKDIFLAKIELVLSIANNWMNTCNYKIIYHSNQKNDNFATIYIVNNERNKNSSVILDVE